MKLVMLQARVCSCAKMNSTRFVFLVFLVHTLARMLYYLCMQNMLSRINAEKCAHLQQQHHQKHSGTQRKDWQWNWRGGGRKTITTGSACAERAKAIIKYALERSGTLLSMLLLNTITITKEHCSQSIIGLHYAFRALVRRGDIHILYY